MPVSLLKLILAEPENKDMKKSGKNWMKKGKTLKMGNTSKGLMGRRASRQTATSKQISSSKIGSTS